MPYGKLVSDDTSTADINICYSGEFTVWNAPGQDSSMLCSHNASTN